MEPLIQQWSGLTTGLVDVPEGWDPSHSVASI